MTSIIIGMIELVLGMLVAQASPELKRVLEVLEQAEQTAAAIKEPYLQSKVWKETAQLRAQARDIEGALKLLGRIPHTYEQCLAYAEVAQTLAKAGASEVAK